ncbi:hypothetical protein AMTR_s00117p00111640 [Amborella trichopoda]|uniref:Uncharacterized protein n=1 Tax=Amborella trichopoda TaxID=13333 RepID=W1NP17_AMBTC|nr:hypothetical protein AMTR_s00117p00111640 [Amborella trichopoda]
MCEQNSFLASSIEVCTSELMASLTMLNALVFRYCRRCAELMTWEAVALVGTGRCGPADRVTVRVLDQPHKFEGPQRPPDRAKKTH